MKILIVDDESLLRDRILTVLKNSDLPIHTYLTADNAFDAIDLVGSEQPELVISDIRMPSKSGLELAAYIHTHCPQTLVILLTGYSEFEYAQSAIQSHVFEYLLKPIESEKLISVVRHAMKKIETAEKQERLFHVFKNHFSKNFQSIRRQYVENLLFSNNTQDADLNRDTYELNFDRYRLIAISCSTATDNAKLESEYYCTHLVEKYVHNANSKTVTYVFGNLVFMIWEVTRPDIFDDNEALFNFLQNLHTYVRRNFLGMLSAGISQVSDTLTNIQLLRHQTSECLEYMRDNGKRDFLLYEDILSTDTTRWEIESQVENLASEISAGNTDAALQTFDRILHHVQEEQSDYLYSACLLIISRICFTMREYKSDTTDLPRLVSPILVKLDHETAEGVVELRTWIEYACSLVVDARQDRVNALVTSVCDYINANYQNPIGLAEASRHVGRNPSYISRLVREYTGKSFTQLLTDKRISEAKLLLSETNLKITEIAERVGYTNVNYFTKVFKAATNMTANDYRNFTMTFYH